MSERQPLKYAAGIGRQGSVFLVFGIEDFDGPDKEILGLVVVETPGSLGDGIVAEREPQELFTQLRLQGDLWSQVGQGRNNPEQLHNITFVELA